MSNELSGVGKEFDIGHQGFIGTDISTVNPVVRLVASIFGFSFTYGDVTLLLDAKTRKNAQEFLARNANYSGSGEWVGTMLRNFLSQCLENQFVVAKRIELTPPLFKQALTNYGIKNIGHQRFVEEALGGTTDGKISATHRDLMKALRPYATDLESSAAKRVYDEVMKQPIPAVKKPQKEGQKVANVELIPEADRPARILEAHRAMCQAFSDLAKVLSDDLVIKNSYGIVKRWFGYGEDVSQKEIDSLSVNELRLVNQEVQERIQNSYNQTKYRPPSGLQESFNRYINAYTVWWQATAGKVVEAVELPVSEPEAVEAARNVDSSLTRELVEGLTAKDVREAIKHRFAALIKEVDENQTFHDRLAAKDPEHYETSLQVLTEIQTEVIKIDSDNYNAKYIQKIANDFFDIVAYAYGKKVPKQLNRQISALLFLLERYVFLDRF